MAHYVVFRLAAPMASHGDVAIGDRRPSAARPTRSAIMGLLAAALGIDRHDDAAQAELSDGCKLAVRLERPGRLLVDYHTVQTPGASRRSAATRAEELCSDRAETIVSRREYRTDVIATVAIAVADGTAHSAEAIAGALRRPRYVLSLGRRSCPLSLPLAPACIEAPDVMAALAAFDAQEPAAAVEFRRLHRLLSREAQSLAADPGMLPDDCRNFRTERRRDRVVSHRRRLFGLREEIVMPLAGTQETLP